MKRSVAIAAMAASVSCIIVVGSRRLVVNTPQVGATAARHVSDPDARPAYRHSVVRTGAYSPGEAQSAMDSDPVVKAHYSSINTARLRRISSPGASMFVSYRRGDDVYWTSKRMRIPEGEAVLSDGTNTIRARCGNRLSETPQQPMQAQEQEPSESELAEVEEPVVHLALALPPVPSPLDPPAGGYTEQSANTVASATTEQAIGRTGAVAGSRLPHMPGRSGLAAPTTGVLSGGWGLLPVREVPYTVAPTPTTGKPAEQEPGGFGAENLVDDTDPLTEIARPIQVPNPGATGTGTGAGDSSRPPDVGSAVVVGPPTKSVVTDSGGADESAEDGPFAGADSIIVLDDVEDERTTDPPIIDRPIIDRPTAAEPPLQTPEPSSMLLLLSGLIALCGLRHHALRA